MSQAGKYFDGTGMSDLETLTGNTGGAVQGDAAQNINVIGADGLTVTGNPGTNTLTITTIDGEFVRTLKGDNADLVPPESVGNIGNINIVGTGGITVIGNIGTNTLTIDGGGGGLDVKVTKFTANDTFIMDARCVYATVIAWNAGSGGGSGRQGASTLACSGTGAAGGSVMVVTFPAIQIDPLGETVTIGAAGVGGATQAVANTNGNDGTAGGYSALGAAFLAVNNGFGSPLGPNGKGGFNPPYPPFPLGGWSQEGIYEYIASTCVIDLGNGGGGGSISTGASAPSSGNVAFGSGALSSYTCTGGGGGSGADSVTPRQAGDSGAIIAYGRGGITILQVGAFGGIETGIIDGDDGVDFVSTTGVRILGATGGGGGGGQSVGLVAGNGGDGGVPSAGGGGGGGSLNGTNSGAGGDGGRGEVWVYEYLGTLTV